MSDPPHVPDVVGDPDAPPEDRLAAVRDQVAEVARRAGRDPDEVRLVGVGKTHGPGTLAAMAAAGLTDLGENRVAELTAKLAVAGQAEADPFRALADVHWHFIGQLQSRKARDVVGRNVLVHSVDRRSLVDELDQRAARAETVQRMLVQVNVGDDPAKGGCSLHEVQALVAYAHDRPNLDVEGLMTVPPQPPPGADPAAAAAPHFASLRAARDRVVADWPDVTELSMGMSADLSAAVAEGATMVRVGTALFGPRRDRPWTGPQSGGLWT